jgi:hypothetical protein
MPITTTSFNFLIKKYQVMLNLFQHPTGRAVCLVYILHVRLYGADFAYEVLKQVQHDILLVLKHRRRNGKVAKNLKAIYRYLSRMVLTVFY